MKTISLYFDVVSCERIFSDYLFMYKDYYVTLHFATEQIIVEVLIDILGEKYVERQILNVLMNVDLDRFDKNKKSFEYIDFYVKFNIDIDEETLFYIKLKYPDSYSSFIRKMKDYYE